MEEPHPKPLIDKAFARGSNPSEHFESTPQRAIPVGAKTRHYHLGSRSARLILRFALNLGLGLSLYGHFLSL